MTGESSTLIGHITDVQGNGMTAALIEDEQGRAPTITVGDEDILVGQVGSYVAVRQADSEIVALLTRMTEREKLAPATDGEPGTETIRPSYAQRTVDLVPVGSLNAAGEFERGVSSFPTTGAEVHAIGTGGLDTMFAKYKAKDYAVGALSSQPSLAVYLEPTPLFGRHFAVLGQTGAGKSWTVANLVQRAVAVMPRAHIILLDLHGEYCWADDSGTSRSAFNEDIVRYVDARELEIPYWLMTYAELCDLLIDQTDHTAHNQTAAFRDALNTLKQKEGKDPDLALDRVTVDTPIYFDLMELRSVLEVQNGKVESASTPGRMVNGPLTGTFDNFLMRLDSRLNDVRYDFLLKPKVRNASSTLSGLLRDFVGLGDPKRPVTVIDISSVPFDVRPVVAAQIGRIVFEFNYWNPLYREFPLLLVCEEAHTYIPRASASQYAGSRQSMERIAKEGRKYGVGLGVVSQRPHEVSETVLSQCGTFICLRITNPDDQSYVRSLVPEAERGLVDILAGLRRGEAMVLGEAVPLPTRIRFYEPNPQPNSDDIDFHLQWREGPEDIDVDAIVNRWRRQER